MNKMRDQSKRRLPWARLLVVTCATLVLVPCLCVGGSVAFLKFQESGASNRWRSLGVPPGSEVEFVTGDTDVVYVRSAGGDIYGCRHQRKVRVDDCWVEAQEPLDVASDTDFGELQFQEDVEPPGTVVDTLDVTGWGPDASFETRYVLLQDGTVWKWETSQVGYFNLIIVALGLIAGGVLGIALVVILWSGVGLRSLWRRTSRQGPDVGN